jgi:cell division septum initiation protein DivIVA
MEPNDAANGSARAQEMRANLGARREVEALLAEASATREAAVADADSIIEEAQQVSDQLLRESRSEAERTSTDARSRAEGLVARARSEGEDITRQARAAADAVRARAEAQVEEHRKRVRAELTEQVTREVAEQNRRELARVHERQQAMIGDIEASVRILGVSMEAAVANISEMLSALDSLRAHTAESLGDAAIPFAASPRHADGELPSDEAVDEGGADVELGRDAVDGPVDDDIDDDTDEGDDDEGDDEDDDDQPVDEEIEQSPARTVRSGHLIDALADLDGAGDDALGELDDQAPPLTATEAFLRSAHIEHDDPPLPPMDDTEIGARYARDAMRASARSRPRRNDEETLEVLPERGSTHRPGRNGKAVPDERVGSDEDAEGAEAEASGKPLGWLFRSS